MEAGIKISVIVLVWNGEKFLDACLAALLAQDYTPFEVIVVDNASNDASVTIAQRYASRVRIIRNQYNLGFAAGNNVGLQVADGDIVILLNQDTVVQAGWLSTIVDTFADSTVGIVGCKALYPDGHRLAHAGAKVLPGNAFTHHIGWGEEDQHQYDTLADVDYVTGAAFAIHRRVLNKLGGLDEAYYPAYYEEIDYCYRTRRAGFRIVYQPRAVLYHYEGTSLPTSTYHYRLAFHSNRVRFVTLHWSRTEWKTFIEEEEHAIASTRDLDDVIARAHAYFENLLMLPIVAFRRRVDVTYGGTLAEGEFRWLVETLHRLRELALERTAALLTDMMPASTTESVVGPTPVLLQESTGDLQTLIHALEHLAVLREPQLHSKIPPFGWLVDSIRSMWFKLIGRHYIFPMTDQQSAFNRQLIELLQRQQHEITVLCRRADVAERLQAIRQVDDSAIPHALRMMCECLPSAPEARFRT